VGWRRVLERTRGSILYLMGNVLWNAFKNVFDKKRDYKILMLGLDGAGKSTILYKFKFSETVTTIPTIGFNCENIQYKNLNLVVWDIAGQEKIRPLWRHYFANTQAVIWVLDASDHKRLTEATKEMEDLLKEDLLRNCLLLVYCNKQDLPLSIGQSELTQTLGLHKFSDKRMWFVQGCCAITGAGLYEGMDWLAQHLS